MNLGRTLAKNSKIKIYKSVLSMTGIVLPSSGNSLIITAIWHEEHSLMHNKPITT